MNLNLILAAALAILGALVGLGLAAEYTIDSAEGTPTLTNQGVLALVFTLLAPLGAIAVYYLKPIPTEDVTAANTPTTGFMHAPPADVVNTQNPLPVPGVADVAAPVPSVEEEPVRTVPVVESTPTPKVEAAPVAAVPKLEK